MATYPFTALVGSDDMASALVLTAVSPQIGGVLVRGEKGTAKSTAVRALAAVLPDQNVVAGCRFACDPDDPDPTCPDGPHLNPAVATRRSRLVELPVGATEDRVVGSLDLEAALGSGRSSYEPGLLAAAHRGILYVDEVNLLHDHLVDLLLDAAAMGRASVEREGISISHAARLVLVGTMNPEEGELRPQLLDRFGLTAEVSAPREPRLRAEVVRRRLAFDADPEAFAQRYEEQETTLRRRIASAQVLLRRVRVPDAMLRTIARVCAGFDVDGMRADIVTARAAAAHAAWDGREEVTKADVRAAARLALPHRRRRNPFDAPGLDEDLLDRLLDDADDDGGDDDGGDDDQRPRDEPEPPRDADGDAVEQETGSTSGPDNRTEAPEGPRPPDRPATDEAPEPTTAPTSHGLAAPTGHAAPHATYRARLVTARGTGRGEPGRRSRAITRLGKVVGVAPASSVARGSAHLPATIRAAAPHQVQRGRYAGAPLALRRGDVRRAVTQGRESNLVLLVVDASGSMAARARMGAVKAAVLSLLLDAYQRRDKVGVITFRGTQAELALPPTSSVEAAARRLAELPHGGRTPLAEALTLTARTLHQERLRDPDRRPLVVVVTDGRATAGDRALPRALAVAGHLHRTGVDSVVVDCESGRLRLGLAGELARRLGAQYVPLEHVAAKALVDVVHRFTGPPSTHQEVA